ncbi:hypothetical protein [Thermococcus sp.]|uniref:hypothetical protein n=1 Tax=Thermococcus sp. TaxID=35749 RepID=UPI002624DE1F|nr:hypothetical protein [Thermococcus sp.]
MKVKLGYKDKLVEMEGGWIYVFNGRLYSAPIAEVVGYYTKGQGIVPGPIREIAGDIIRVLLRTGELERYVQPQIGYGESLSS